MVKTLLPPTPSEQDAIYETLMRYGFPMRTSLVNQRFIEQMPKRKKELLDVCEKTFLESELNTILNGISLLTIPKTLYQLYFIVYVYEHKIELPNFDATTRIYTNDKAMDEFIETAINNPRYKAIWWEVNNRLSREWTNSLMSIDSFIETQMQKFSQLINDQPLIPCYAFGACSGRDLAYYLGSEPAFRQAIQCLKTVVLKEYLENGYYLIYRACPLGRNNLISANLALAFNDGLMGGFLSDLSTGCCLQGLISNYSGRILKTFFINKKEYQDNHSRVRNLIYIPPIPSVLRLLGAGEYHHPRTKVSSRWTRRILLGVSSPGIDVTVKPKIGHQAVFIANDLSPETHVQELQKLCAEHYEITPIVTANVADEMLNIDHHGEDSLQHGFIVNERELYRKTLTECLFLFSAHSSEHKRSYEETQLAIVDCIASHTI